MHGRVRQHGLWTSSRQHVLAREQGQKRGWFQGPGDKVGDALLDDVQRHGAEQEHASPQQNRVLSRGSVCVCVCV